MTPVTCQDLPISLNTVSVGWNIWVSSKKVYQYHFLFPITFLLAFVLSLSFPLSSPLTHPYFLAVLTLCHLYSPVVFMGSEKYPSENGFDAFLKKHGGSDNASTDCERTIFQFDVQRKHFQEALDRCAVLTVWSLLSPGNHRCSCWEVHKIQKHLHLKVKRGSIF